MSMKMARMEGGSRDEVSANVEALKKAFPSAVKEGKVDFEVLRTLLGDDVATDAGCYRMTWNGKEAARQFALKRSRGTLVPDRGSSRDWETTQNVAIMTRRAMRSPESSPNGLRSFGQNSITPCVVDIRPPGVDDTTGLLVAWRDAYRPTNEGFYVLGSHILTNLAVLFRVDVSNCASNVLVRVDNSLLPTNGGNSAGFYSIGPDVDSDGDGVA